MLPDVFGVENAPFGGSSCAWFSLGARGDSTRVIGDDGKLNAPDAPEIDRMSDPAGEYAAEELPVGVPSPYSDPISPNGSAPCEIWAIFCRRSPPRSVGHLWMNCCVLDQLAKVFFGFPDGESCLPRRSFPESSMGNQFSPSRACLFPSKWDLSEISLCSLAQAEVGEVSLIYRSSSESAEGARPEVIFLRKSPSGRYFSFFHEAWFDKAV